LELPEGYLIFIKKIKDTIARQRIKAVLSASTEMIMLYWEIGSGILERQKMNTPT
jgi:hypothetical protein